MICHVCKSFGLLVKPQGHAHYYCGTCRPDREVPRIRKTDRDERKAQQQRVAS